jgi:hypothetical protein
VSKGFGPPERPLELVPISPGRLGIRNGRMVQVGDLDLDRTPSATRQLVVAGMYEQAVDPDVEAIGIAKTGRSRRARANAWTASFVRS